MKLRPSTSTIGRLSIAAIATAGLALGVACSGGGSSGNSSGPFAGGASFMGAPASPTARGSSDSPSRIADAIAAASSQAQAGNQAQAKGIDPCRLITREEVNAAVGGTFDPGKRSNDVSGGSCDFEDEESIRGVTVTVQKGGSSRPTYDGVRNMFTTEGRQDISGLGDKAFLAAGLRTPYVLKGDVLLSVQVIDFSVGSQQSLAAMTTLARTALGRL